MSERRTRTDSAGEVRLRAQTTCPNCWHRFPPEDVLFVARHADLRGDLIAGADAHVRFRPSRFTLDGDAIDPKGLRTHQLACPRCHGELSRALLELEPLYVSIVGAPASGKSYFLGSMVWSLRSLLPRLGCAFTDTDPDLNQVVIDYEQTLFLATGATGPVTLAKTETDGALLYRTAHFDGHVQILPRPFQFTIGPLGAANRVLVLYDNAGEHFLPGQDQARTPVTQHLARSEAIFFVFDPTQEPRFRPHCRTDDPQVGAVGRTVAARQETILNEAALRVRNHRGLGHGRRHDVPLIVVVAKADVWIHALPDVDLTSEPILSATTDPELPTPDEARIRAVSDACRALLMQTCPEFVAAAESFCSTVWYVPASALGGSPVRIDQPGGGAVFGVRPGSIRPQWVTAPMLVALRKTLEAVRTAERSQGFGLRDGPGDGGA